MAQMKEQMKTPKTEWSNEKVANLSDAQFKTLVSGCSQKWLSMVTKQRESEAYAKWNKEKYTGNQQWREGNQDSNQWFAAEEINIQPEQNEETRIQKNEERLRNLWDNFKCSNIQIIGVQEREEEDQEMENSFEKIMKENFPNMAKEIAFQEVQKAQSPKEVGPKEAHPRHIIITLPKIKHKERILKAAREKQTVIYKGVPIRQSANFSKETLQARRGWKEVFRSHEQQGPPSKITLSIKAFI